MNGRRTGKTEIRTVRMQRGSGDASLGAYERSDMSPRVAGWSIAGLGGLVILIAAAVAGLFLLFGGMSQPPAPSPRLDASAPALQRNERLDRLAIEARARARLEGRGGGAPIATAMQRTAEAGWDAAR